MPKTARKTCATELICPKCGNIFTIQRIITRKRKFMHVKNLYCPICRKVTRHIEIHDRKMARMKLQSYEERTEKEEFLLELLTPKDALEEERQSDKRYTLSKKIWKSRNV